MIKRRPRLKVCIRRQQPLLRKQRYRKRMYLRKIVLLISLSPLPPV
jgi:hypothetical protein